MVDTVRRGFVNAYMPKLGEYITTPLAYQVSQVMAEAVDFRFRAASRGFPEGMEYLGCSRVTPNEAFMEMTRAGTADITRSNLRLLKVSIGWQRDVINFFIMTPWINPDGELILSSTIYRSTMVLTDPSLSPSPRAIFVRLATDKFSIHQVPFDVIIDDEPSIVPLSVMAVYRSRNGWKKHMPVTTTVIYLLGRYGLRETLRRFGHCTEYRVQSNTDAHRDKDWSYFRTSGIVTKSMNTMNTAAPNRLVISVKKKDCTPFVREILSAAMHAIDHEPISFNNDPRLLDSPTEWLSVLGSFIALAEASSVPMSAADIITGMESHFSDLATIYVTAVDTATMRDEYGDAFADNLLEDGFWKLIGYCCENFTRLTLNPENTTHSVAGKRVESLYYLLFPIMVGINMLAFKMRQACANGNVPGHRTVADAIRACLPRGGSFKIPHSNMIFVHSETPNDVGIFDRTAIKPQTAGSGAIANSSSQGTPASPTSEANALTAQQPFINNLVVVKKSEPGARTSLNPYAVFVDGVLVVADEFKSLVEELDDALNAPGDEFEVFEGADAIVDGGVYEGFE